jgi:hypothetical protein
MKLNLKVEDQSIFKPRKLNSTLVGCLFLSEKLTWMFVPLKPRIMHVHCLLDQDHVEFIG